NLHPKSTPCPEPLWPRAWSRTQGRTCEFPYLKSSVPSEPCECLSEWLGASRYASAPAPPESAVGPERTDPGCSSRQIPAAWLSPRYAYRPLENQWHTAHVRCGSCRWRARICPPQ